MIKKIIKPKKIFPLLVAFFSFDLYLGGVIGYFLSKFYDQKIYGKKIKKLGLKLDSILIPLGKYRLHLHHWMYPLCLFLGAAIFKISFLFSPFIFGFFCGIIIHDLVWDRDRFKILRKTP